MCDCDCVTMYFFRTGERCRWDKKSAINFFLLGKGGELVDRGDNTYGGKWVVNPSGGLISKGHPLGATGTRNKRYM